ncbi:MAG: D-tyrosyl-tRNA(Tyr) deacylase [Candidatus Omnitrophica bacterium]|nr:D-tyrosyl-tRNA(Tyr) deacylase [Candidatus Omnitrophota bacterium]
MKVILQRVTEAKVVVAGEVIGAIKKGVLVFVAVEKGDGETQAAAMVRKVQAFRLFPSGEKKNMDLSTADVGGEFLVVSQFTLAADCNDGNRPSFDPAAPPDVAEKLYEYFVAQLSQGPCRVATGKFRAMMEVSLVNDGPVTFILESK